MSSKTKSRRDPVYDLFKQVDNDVAHVVCSQQGCNTRLGLKADTLKKHLSRHHREVYDTLTAGKSQESSTLDKYLAEEGKTSNRRHRSEPTQSNRKKRDYEGNYISGAQQISKVEVFEEVLDETNGQSILWASTGESLEKYIDESQLEDLSVSAIGAANEDLKRNKKLFKAKPDSAIDAALSRFLIACNLTFDIIDSPHFKNFANSLNESYKVPSSSQLKSRLLSQLETLEAPSVKHRSKKRKQYNSSSSSSDD